MSPNVPAKPEVLKWLRKSSGWSLEELSKHTKISINSISKWERGDTHPTYNDIMKLAEAYKRPTAAFLLPHPMKERPLPHDFRRLPGKQKELTVKTLRAIRRAQHSQKISKELMENLNQKIDPDIKTVSLNDSPEKIAYRERSQLDLTLEVQTGWNNEYEAFKRLRNLIESRNIMVFQFRMDVEELRGFTLLDMKPYIIVINARDNIRARIFTLIHEYGHVLLNEPALCNPEDPTIDTHGANVERWCNRFAGAFLLPFEVISKEFKEYGLKRYRTIANKYKVSYLMVLIRLASLKLINDEQCQGEINILKENEAQKEKEAENEEEESSGPRETSADRSKREMGEEFISLVVRNSDRGYITFSDALGYLNIKTHHFEDLMKYKP